MYIENGRLTSLKKEKFEQDSELRTQSNGKVSTVFTENEF